MDLMDLYYQNEYDKLERGYQLDKFDHMYLQKYYNKEFVDKRENEIKLLEIGVARGVSIRFWSEWFTNGTIYGIEQYHQDEDYTYFEKYGLKNIIMNDAVKKETSDMFMANSMDYIIDDGSHQLLDQIIATELYLPKIKPNGKMIIEDIRNISYVPILIDSINKEWSYEWNLYDLRYINGRNYPSSIILEIIRNDKMV